MGMSRKQIAFLYATGVFKKLPAGMKASEALKLAGAKVKKAAPAPTPAGKKSAPSSGKSSAHPDYTKTKGIKDPAAFRDALSKDNQKRFEGLEEYYQQKRAMWDSGGDPSKLPSHRIKLARISGSQKAMDHMKKELKTGEQISTGPKTKQSSSHTASKSPKDAVSQELEKTLGDH